MQCGYFNLFAFSLRNRRNVYCVHSQFQDNVRNNLEKYTGENYSNFTDNYKIKHFYVSVLILKCNMQNILYI